MQTQNRFLDDFARMLGGAAGALSGIRNEVETLVRQQIERLLGDMELVTRDEFEAARAMAQEARTRQEELQDRLGALQSNGRSRGANDNAAGCRGNHRKPRRAVAANLRRARRHARATAKKG